MNTLLKKMMVALLALGIGQAAWADDTLNVEEVAQKEMLQLAEAGDVELQFMNMGKVFVKTMQRRCAGIARQRNRDMQKPKIIWV